MRVVLKTFAKLMVCKVSIRIPKHVFFLSLLAKKVTSFSLVK